MKLHITYQDLELLSSEQINKHTMAFYPPMFMLQTINDRIVDGKANKLEISDDAKLFIYIISDGEFLCLPTIGQMMEYLFQQKKKLPSIDNDFCDNLWLKVKGTYA